MRTWIRISVVGLLLVLLAVGCSSDNRDDRSDSEADVLHAFQAATGRDDGGGTEAIDHYCSSVDQFVAASDALAADPSDSASRETVTDLGGTLDQETNDLDAVIVVAQSVAPDLLTDESHAKYDGCKEEFTSTRG